MYLHRARLVPKLTSSVPVWGKHGSYRRGLARAVWEPNSLLQLAVMAVNVHICFGVPALTASVFLPKFSFSVIISSFTSLFTYNVVKWPFPLSSALPFYTSFLHCFPFKNILFYFFFFAHEKGRRQAPVGHSALTTLINPLHCNGMGSKREREKVLSDGDKGRREGEFGREEWWTEEGEMKHSGRLGKSLTDAHSLYVYVYSLHFLPAFIKGKDLPSSATALHHFLLPTPLLFLSISVIVGPITALRCSFFGGHKYPRRVPNLQCSCEGEGSGGERVGRENMGQREQLNAVLKCAASRTRSQGTCLLQSEYFGGTVALRCHSNS